MASRHMAGHTKSICEDVTPIKGEYNWQPSRIEDSIREKEIPHLRRSKLARTLNTVEDSNRKNKLEHLFAKYEASSIETVSVSEIKLILKEMSLYKGSTIDQIPVAFIRLRHIKLWVFWYFTLTLHRVTATSGTLPIPIDERNLKDLSGQENCRLIAIASAAANFFEKVILRRLLHYLDTSNV